MNSLQSLCLEHSREVFLSVTTHRVSSDDKWRRHEQQLLAFPYVLQSDKPSLPYLDPLNGHFLGREAGVRQPLLKRRSIFEGIDVTAPGYLLAIGGGSTARGDRATDSRVPGECGALNEGTVGILMRREGRDQRRMEYPWTSFSHGGRRERERECESLSSK